VIGVAKDWAEYSEGGCVVENRAKGNGGRLDGWEVWKMNVSNTIYSSQFTL
jgi:hypothetical protein